MTLFLAFYLTTAPVPAEQLSYGTEPREVLGRYRDFVGDTLTMFGSPVIFKITDTNHARVILALKPSKDNLVIQGRFKKTEATKPAGSKDPLEFMVTSVRRAPSDLEYYHGKADEAAGNADALTALGKEAMGRAALYGDTELKQKATTILREGFSARKKGLAASDVEGHLSWLTVMIASLNDIPWALEVAQEFQERNPENKEIERFLDSIGCVKWRGTWLRHDEYMKAQGYISVRGEWVLPQDQSFVKTHAQVERLRASLPFMRKNTAEFFQLQAEKGDLLIGMNRREAVTAWGFPDDVRRVSRGEETFDQWRYGESTLYFLDSTLFKFPPNKERPSRR